MKKILQKIETDRITINILRGTSIGLLIWILHLVFYRIFGVDPEYFLFVGRFMLIGAVLGGSIGLISSEISWHKNHNKK